MPCRLSLGVLLALTAIVRADGPADNIPDNVRRIPPLPKDQMSADVKAPWTTQTGPVAGGYVSRIDGSVQPYGLVVPKDFQPGGPKRRLDVWCHGRGETLSEINFLQDRMNNPGQFTPAGAFVLHPY